MLEVVVESKWMSLKKETIAYSWGKVSYVLSDILCGAGVISRARLQSGVYDSLVQDLPVIYTSSFNHKTHTAHLHRTEYLHDRFLA
jgi:hypothetical protein